MKYSLSLIIPVYNVENYLTQCLDSVIFQNDKRIEIIIIDDCSTDNSIKICNKYKNVENVKVFHNDKNVGISATRNFGISKCEGKYIGFIDADDFIFCNSINIILHWIENNEADICYLDAYKKIEDKIIAINDGLYRKEIFSNNIDDLYLYLSTKRRFSGSACTKIYNTNFIKKNRINFPNDSRIGEDLTFVRNVLIKAKTFDIINIPYYVYRQNVTNSRSNVFTKKSFDDLMMFVNETFELSLNENSNKKKFLINITIYEYLICVYKTYMIKDLINQKYCCNELNRVKKILSYGNAIYKLTYMLILIIGMNKFIILLNRIKKVYDKKN